MTRLLFALFAALSVLSACAATPPGAAIGPDGRPLPQSYRISGADESRIQYEMLDAINSLRRASGAPEVSLNSQLNAAAATHSRDMAIQNRPWHFGSDGSSPIDRARRVGYNGRVLGENISETYETELETLAAWMEDSSTKTVILDQNARDLGFSWHQENNGKIWWTLVMGSREMQPRPVGDPSGIEVSS